MSRYQNRLDRIEATISPEREPQVCFVFGDDDADTKVAQLRAARNWPDDGTHPVQVIRVRWGRA
jgi:hypothetical protein